MAQRRIAFTSEESLLLTFDRGVIYAYEAIDGALKWKLALEKAPVVSIVYAANSALTSDVAAGPWRSPASASTAIALDSEGTLHAIDAVLGRILGTVAHEGLVPLGLASGGDALAVAFEDRVVIHRGGTRDEVKKRASALAFSRDGLTIAIGTSRGDLFFYDVASKKLAPAAPPGGTIADIAPRPGGGWLVSSERGMTAVHAQKTEKQLNGAVNGVITNVAGKQLAVHRSEANVVLYHWPPTTPIGRISATGGTIRDIAFGADNKVGIAMAGGGGAIVDTETFEVLRTAQLPGEKRARWLVAAESEKARLERTAEQSRRAQAHEAKPGNGARFGVGAFITIAIFVVRFCLIGARASTSYTPPPYNDQDFSKVTGCDHACEGARLVDLLRSCKASQAVPCAEQASDAIKAFKRSDCSGAKAALNEIDTMLKGSATGSSADPMVNAGRFVAMLGLETGCLQAPKVPAAPLQLVHLRGKERSPEVDAIALDDAHSYELAAAPDGTLFLATRSADDECTVRRKAAKGTQWSEDIAEDHCGSVPTLFARSPTEIYASMGHDLWHFDGKAWRRSGDVPAIPRSIGGAAQAKADVFGLSQAGDTMIVLDPKTDEAKLLTLAGKDDGIDTLFPGTTSVWGRGVADDGVFLYRWSGKAWTRRAAVPERMQALWQSPGGHLYVATTNDLYRSTDDGATLRRSSLSALVAHVWGRSNTDVYATGMGTALWHFDGVAWSSTGDPGSGLALTGDEHDLHLITRE